MGTKRIAVFFFSSRRRHTRYWRDWSSDVCSSDLEQLAEVLAQVGSGARQSVRELRTLLMDLYPTSLRTAGLETALCQAARSEERRVGKECRSRWSPYH